jgi:hypothetical protein
MVSNKLKVIRRIIRKAIRRNECADKSFKKAPGKRG